MSGRDGYRTLWRQLSQAMVAAAGDPALDPEPLAVLSRAQQANRWPCWLDDKDAIMLCGAAGAMAAAYRYAASIKRRCHYAEALRATGAALGDLLDRTETPAAEAERKPLNLWWAGQEGEDA